MSWVDFVRGLGNVLIIMAIAGAVAYVGDRVGHQVGRRRLTLFGIRPRYTSTIIAVATGVFIALVVTLVAILASEQVKTAFFRLSALNSQITQLQRQQQQLEAKVTNGRLVVATGALITPFRLILQQSQTPAQREQQLRAFYTEAVKYINATYPGLGLKPYTVPRNIDTVLHNFVTEPVLQAELSQSNVMLTAISDQNLFVNDPFHFSLSAVPDVRVFAKGQLVAQLKIPGGSGASINIAVRELQAEVTTDAEYAHMPPFLATYVQPTQLVPNIEGMQAMLERPGLYYLTAYAAEDTYPHTGVIPIDIALVPARNVR
ncbi:MAG TPA: DUF3084 domain-containing protein [Candidatus Tyrphobacter sp.]